MYEYIIETRITHCARLPGPRESCTLKYPVQSSMCLVNTLWAVVLMAFDVSYLPRGPHLKSVVYFFTLKIYDNKLWKTSFSNAPWQQHQRPHHPLWLNNQQSAQQRHTTHDITLWLKVMFGSMHFIYYINRSIATKVDSTYLNYWPTAHSVYVLWRPVGVNQWHRDHYIRPLTDCATHVDMNVTQWITAKYLTAETWTHSL